MNGRRVMGFFGDVTVVPLDQPPADFPGKARAHGRNGRLPIDAQTAGLGHRKISVRRRIAVRPRPHLPFFEPVYRMRCGSCHGDPSFNKVNVEHPTLNIQHRMKNKIGRSMFDVHVFNSKRGSFASLHPKQPRFSDFIIAITANFVYVPTGYATRMQDPPERPVERATQRPHSGWI